MRPATLYTLETGEAHTIREWAAITGIPYITISTRLRRGLSLERALAPKRAPDAVSFNGQTLTFNEWSALTGLRPRTIYARLYLLGWSVERALTEAPNVWTPSGPTIKPGVVLNFAPSKGTGGGSVAQDIPQIEFSE